MKGIFIYFFLLFPAFFIAMAMLCFCGLPDLTNSAIFFERTFLLFPFFKGISNTSFSWLSILLNPKTFIFH